MPEVLIDAKPTASFRIDDYTVPAAPITHPLVDGEVIDLGDRRFEVLHLPGHSPGSCCLFEWTTGILFSGDVLYDDVLLDELDGSDVEQYIASLTRLRQLDATVVYPGHGEPFTAPRMRELIDQYIDARTAREPSSG
jgi:glyoxylase-like metal-dependent hydrolase (beta-lactamase superfamily II)